MSFLIGNAVTVFCAILELYRSFHTSYLENTWLLLGLSP
jgi:hypothetical protein